MRVKQPTNDGQLSSEQQIDANIDSILRVSGSALNHHCIQSDIDAMRKAMRDIMSRSYIAGCNMHIEFMREDSLEKANDIIAQWYGANALGGKR